MLHNKTRKSKGEKRVHFKDLHARNAASATALANKSIRGICGQK
jgi:hypothetical protein